MLSSTRRPVSAICQTSSINQIQQVRWATLIKRPKTPYTFTQLVTLSDGSTFLQRTTSPAPVLQSTKDTKNTALWNPSNEKLRNREEDLAGRLRAFRNRFGRGWDAETSRDQDEGAEIVETDVYDDLTDLMNASAKEAGDKGKSKK